MQKVNFDINEFLSTYWQKKPVVLRQAFTDFTDFLDEHDLAGLSEDDDVDSRIIQNVEGTWQVTQGPFEDFAPLCTGKWTLLVQGVDKYLEDASDLMRAFSFIPHWRMDDLMISFANAGAGVGPHLDQYDVFLLQGKGQRHWKVGEPGNYETQFPHPLLAQIEAFEPVIDTVLKPGDVLYIPPGWPHDGIALEDCLTYSVGFRAPDQSQLFDVLPDMFDESDLKNIRYTDPMRAATSDAALVSDADLCQLKAMIKNALETDACNTALLRFLSNQYLPEDVPDELVNRSDVVANLHQGCAILPAPGCRPVYAHTSDPFTFYVNGEAFQCQEKHTEMMLANFAGQPLPASLADNPDCTIFDLLATLINKGYWAME
ncbi:cupin domain-containing protein [Salinimonas sp. HHU 13199]|uniref:Cupin domain-containing protein n=1 Tax=Salinimonas profundi TaxID=2729140 RepID=A0ABR8LG93_9ALTE|nr:cupin domain-containing protein [Salinimonas profundi]MBD3584325.1 cupin domain-containing protein [Salinimonas profundi]